MTECVKYFSTLVIIVLCTFGSISEAESATLEEAQAAFEDLRQFSGDLIRKTNAQILDLNKLTHIKLESIENATLSELYAKHDEVNRTITDILAKAQEAGVDTTRCNWSADRDYARFRVTMEERIRNCTLKNLGVITEEIYETYNLMGKAQGNTLGCNSRSLIQCSRYDVNRNNASCFEFVINNIEQTKRDIGTTFAGFGLLMENKVETVRLPCGDLIASQLAVYPSLVLNHVSACVNTHSKLMVPTTC